MSDASDLVGGVVGRAVEFAAKQFLPELESLAPGPLGLLIKAALATDWAKNLESEVAGKLGALTSEELAKLEAQVAAWAKDFMAAHPAAKAFFEAVKPPPPTKFTLTDAQETALLAAIADGTLNAKLGVAA